MKAKRYTNIGSASSATRSKIKVYKKQTDEHDVNKRVSIKRTVQPAEQQFKSVLK